VLLLSTAAMLSGCEMLAVTLYGAPPYGGPWSGAIYDTRTGLPVGGATILADWTPPVTTDREGRYNLPNLIPAGVVTIARAGYVTQTRQGLALTDHPDVYLEPRYATNGTGASRGIGLAGIVTSANKPVANAFLTYTAGPNTSARTDGQGRYGMLLRLPTGNIATGMLGGGITSGDSDGSGGKPLEFTAFGNRAVTLGPGDPQTNPQNANINLTLAPLAGSIGLAMGNPPLPNLQVEASMDFGMLGQMLVYRATGATGSIPVPKNGVQYQVTVIAADDAGNNQSTAATRVMGGAQASVDFLAPPVITGPPHQATGVGSRPTFSWSAVPGAALYAVDVYEQKTDAKPVWQGLTDRTSISFPFIPQNFNDAALKRGGDPANPFFYTWSVTALETTTAEALLTSVGPGSSVGRESVSRNAEFAL
jgi:hypothetical protein